MNYPYLLQRYWLWYVLNWTGTESVHNAAPSGRVSDVNANLKYRTRPAPGRALRLTSARKANILGTRTMRGSPGTSYAQSRPHAGVFDNQNETPSQGSTQMANSG